MVFQTVLRKLLPAIIQKGWQAASTRTHHHIWCANVQPFAATVNLANICHPYGHLGQNNFLGHNKSGSLHSTSTMSSQAPWTNPKNGMTQSQELLITQMNMRMVNENSFLSWCRNAYLSTVVGAAMITEGSTALAQGAGAGAFIVGGMNLLWGTGCHVTNLIRLRQVTGMSKITLFLNLLGSITHCFLWLFVVICYVGFLDENNSFDGRRRPGEENFVPPSKGFNPFPMNQDPKKT